MGSFGERMQREREMRGISLEEISKSTKIGVRSLRALEEENFKQLPGGIFNKGFVRAYARYLGIDEEQAVADFQAARSEPPPPSVGQSFLKNDFKVEPPVDADELEKTSGFFALALAIALVAVIAVLGFGGWKYWRGGPHLTQIFTGSHKDNASAESESRAAPAQREARNSVTRNVENKATGKPTDPAAAKAVNFTVKIKATKDSWVSVRADGTRLFEAVMKAETEKDFAAEKELVLKTGNFGGLELTHNGKAIGPAGSGPQTRTITFNNEGIKPPAKKSP